MLPFTHNPKLLFFLGGKCYRKSNKLHNKQSNKLLKPGLQHQRQQIKFGKLWKKLHTVILYPLLSKVPRRSQCLLRCLFHTSLSAAKVEATASDRTWALGFSTWMRLVVGVRSVLLLVTTGWEVQ